MVRYAPKHCCVLNLYHLSKFKKSRIRNMRMTLKYELFDHTERLCLATTCFRWVGFGVYQTSIIILISCSSFRRNRLFKVGSLKQNIVVSET